MKITDFINSKSIAKHLDDLHYRFNAVEAAYIVWQSECSMRKKYAAWQAIIDTFPDMPLKERRWGFEKDEPSFLTFLQNYVASKKSRKPLPCGCDPFEGLWLKIPTPFKAGDIVYQGDTWVYKGERPKQPFVLMDIASWGGKELRENGYTDEKLIAKHDWLVRHHTETGDISDMLSGGKFVDEFGRVYDEHTLSGTYLNLDYYDEPLTGEKRILIALSNYVQKKIDIAQLANAYRIIMDETRIEYVKKYTGGAYLDEHLRAAGWK